MNRKLFSLLSIASLFLFVVVACSPDDGNDNNGWNQNNTNNVNNTNNQICSEGDQRCFANTIQNCTNGQWINDTVCGMNGELPVCDDTSSPAKCAECIAGGTICGEDNNVHTCTANGEVGLVERECDSSAGETCIDANGTATCDSPCLRAAAKNSYRGCDYWVISTANSGLGTRQDEWTGGNVFQDTFDNNFGIAIDNSTNDIAVNVTITNNSQSLVSDSVPAGELKVFLLPYNLAVRQAGSDPVNSPDTALYDAQSGIYRNAENQGAYHLVTTLPVTVYQFNPYDYALQDSNSYSNDASLVLPTPVLSNNYIVMSRPTLNGGNTSGSVSIPGTVTVVATENNTTVTVNTKAYTSGGSGVGALSPGDTQSYTLNQGDVLQIASGKDIDAMNCPGESVTEGTMTYCDPGAQYDLTGTEITSDSEDKPIAVWGGHNCDHVPMNYPACDHLEEMMIPLETWGNHFFVGLTRQVEIGSEETNLIKILSGEDGVNVSFNPSFENPASLNKGEYISFLAPVGQHFEIEATGPIMVGKFTVGQNFWTDSYDAMGDPAFGQVVPVEQYRSEYSFATPESMTVNYVNVIAQIPTDNSEFITINGESITAEDYEAIGSTGYGVARIDITDAGTGGSHRIEAPNDSITFGIEVYGFASYTSYLYPGGLDLEYINPIE